MAGGAATTIWVGRCCRPQGCSCRPGRRAAALAAAVLHLSQLQTLDSLSTPAGSQFPRSWKLKLSAVCTALATCQGPCPHREVDAGARGAGLQQFTQHVHIAAGRADGDANCGAAQGSRACWRSVIAGRRPKSVCIVPHCHNDRFLLRCMAPAFIACRFAYLWFS